MTVRQISLGMTAADYVGLAGLITSSGAVVTSIIIAFRQTTTHRGIEAVQEAVTLSNGHQLADVVEHDILPGMTQPNGPIVP